MCRQDARFQTVTDGNWSLDDPVHFEQIPMASLLILYRTMSAMALETLTKESRVREWGAADNSPRYMDTGLGCRISVGLYTDGRGGRHEPNGA